MTVGKDKVTAKSLFAHMQDKAKMSKKSEPFTITYIEVAMTCSI